VGCDVEYYCQSWQIAVGQADPTVRVTNTLAAIYRLAAGGHLAIDQGARLRSAYSLLRRLIDALRAVRGHAKDLTVPPPASREYAYLAQRLHYQSPAELRTALTAAMADARTLWEQEPPPGR
jgi:glutamate-ammonia-ligase adenylyltransferase